MKLIAKEIRDIMKLLSKTKGNPLGFGTVESYLAPFDISEIVERMSAKHVRFYLGLDINVVVNTRECL